MAQHDTRSFKKVAVLTGLTVLVGGAEISGADAATIFQSQLFPAFQPGQSPSNLEFNFFNPAAGNLTDVKIDLVSTVASPVNAFGITATVQLPSTTLIYPGGTSSLQVIGQH